MPKQIINGEKISIVAQSAEEKERKSIKENIATLQKDFSGKSIELLDPIEINKVIKVICFRLELLDQDGKFK